MKKKNFDMEKDRLIWRRMKAGTKLPGDCLVVYDHDPDPRLSRSAIYDGWYLPVSGLLSLLEEQKEEVR